MEYRVISGPEPYGGDSIMTQLTDQEIILPWETDLAKVTKDHYFRDSKLFREFAGFADQARTLSPSPIGRPNHEPQSKEVALSDANCRVVQAPRFVTGRDRELAGLKSPKADIERRLAQDCGKPSPLGLEPPAPLPLHSSSK
jgi:hypothetical protein